VSSGVFKLLYSGVWAAEGEMQHKEQWGEIRPPPVLLMEEVVAV
jgi:hypothetical protein